MSLDTTKKDWYKKHADLNEEKEFHKKRITFLIINEEIKFLTNSEMSYYTWAKSLGIDDDKFNNIVRGFYLNGKAIFYKGNFTYDSECIEKAKIFANKVKAFSKAETLEIWCGQKIGKIGEFWPPEFHVLTL